MGASFPRFLGVDPPVGPPWPAGCGRGGQARGRPAAAPPPRRTEVRPWGPRQPVAGQAAGLSQSSVSVADSQSTASSVSDRVSARAARRDQPGPAPSRGVHPFVDQTHAVSRASVARGSPGSDRRGRADWSAGSKPSCDWPFRRARQVHSTSWRAPRAVWARAMLRGQPPATVVVWIPRTCCADVGNRKAFCALESSRRAGVFRYL